MGERSVRQKHPYRPADTRRWSNVYGRQQVDAEAKKRGLRGALYYPYVTSQFVVEDWDFPAEYWRHWEALSKSDPRIWAKVAGRVLEQRDSYWSRASSARLSQVATTGSTRSLTSESLLADWLLKLRAKPCLPDTRDMIHVPADLLRRTPETESLMDVEPFVHGLLDRETTRPLLDLLGVRSSPSGPGRLLDRLRALAKSDKAPAHEVEKWYRRLDQMLDAASTPDAQSIKDAFKAEKLILAQDGTWVTSGGVFLAGDEEDVPGAAVIRASVLDLSLWRRVGVAERPSADLALQWLGTLASGKALSPDDARRVRTLMSRYPTRIWGECGHWVNMSGEWVETDALAYPCLRGTAIQLGDKDAYLWTTGYAPRIDTYIGPETPNPLFVTVLRASGDYPSIETVLADILGLTKINYNACNFSDGLPVTIRFADKVGEVLTMGSATGAERQPFKFYV